MPDLILRLREDDEGATTPVAPIPDDEAPRLLTEGEITASQLVPWGSNYTFGVALTLASGREQLAIYKPRRGEAPLYDFPEGTLYRREYASYMLSERLGWRLVPPTVVRDGPHGIGTVQLYVEPDPNFTDQHAYWNQCAIDIERIVLFDHIANNADRKIGHCLRDVHGHIWGIDHGLTFNHVPKLRTVLWQFVGAPIHPDLLKDLRALAAAEETIRAELGEWLSRREVEAFVQRVHALLQEPRYPALNSRRNVPYGWW